MKLAVYLAQKEVWRNKGRYLLFSLVIALITILVLFVAALGLGLSNANRQMIDKIDAELLVTQADVDLSLAASRLSAPTRNAVRRVNGVADVGMMAFSTAKLSVNGESVDVSLIGVEPGHAGTPALLSGEPLANKRGNEVILDEAAAKPNNIQIGDVIVLKTIQGDEEEQFELTVVGITDERAYYFQPAVFLPLYTWDEVRPKGLGEGNGQPVANALAVQLDDPAEAEAVAARISRLVDDIEVADKDTLARALPGYTAQQITVETQRGFALVIGILVVGGFFQIQTLQKVPQIGMLKAIGTDNGTVGLSALAQIVLVTVIGVAIGGAFVFLTALGLPPVVPLRFNLPTTLIAVGSLLLIGPLGGLVSVRLALRIDPLTAINQNG